VRIEIERLATARAARAIRGYGVRLNECADTPSLSQCSLLAGRSRTPLGSAVSARFADAVETVSDLAQASYDDRLALSDAVPPPAEALNVLLPDGGVAAASDDPAAYMNAVWNGPTGPSVPLRSARAMALFNLLDLRLDYARGQTPAFASGSALSTSTLREVRLRELLFTDWDGELRGFSVGPGRIEGARALAAERYLTTPLSASDGALLAPYLRRELVGRPLFSDVRVRFYDRPGSIGRS